MLRKTLIANALVVPIIAGAAPALAEGGEHCTELPKEKWISEDSAKAKAAELGYRIRDLKVEGSCFAIYAMDKDGKRAELLMDPASGKIVGNEEGEE